MTTRFHFIPFLRILQNIPVSILECPNSAGMIRHWNDKNTIYPTPGMCLPNAATMAQTLPHRCFFLPTTTINDPTHPPPPSTDSHNATATLRVARSCPAHASRCPIPPSLLNDTMTLTKPGAPSLAATWQPDDKQQHWSSFVIFVYLMDATTWCNHTNLVATTKCYKDPPPPPTNSTPPHPTNSKTAHEQRPPPKNEDHHPWMKVTTHKNKCPQTTMTMHEQRQQHMNKKMQATTHGHRQQHTDMGKNTWTWATTRGHG